MGKTKKPAGRRKTDYGPLLSIKEAAQRLHRNPMTVRRLIRTKKLQAVLVSWNVMVVKESLEEYLSPRPYRPQRGAPVCAGHNRKGQEAVGNTAPHEARL